MDSRESDPEPSSGNPNPAESARGDALLEQIQKIDLTGIEDERSRAIIRLLLNVVEDLRGELKKAQQEIAPGIGWRSSLLRQVSVSSHDTGVPKWFGLSSTPAGCLLPCIDQVIPKGLTFGKPKVSPFL